MCTGEQGTVLVLIEDVESFYRAHTWGRESGAPCGGVAVLVGWLAGVVRSLIR
jgi:hypothetical protein